VAISVVTLQRTVDIALLHFGTRRKLRCWRPIYILLVGSL